MSLTRLPLRATPATSRRCTRYVSTTATRHSAEDLLDILPKGRQVHPSAQQSPLATESKPSSSLVSKFAQYALQGGTASAKIQQRKEQADFQRHMYRRWNTGDVYAPHDLSGVEQKKWKMSRKTAQSDAFDMLGINPVNEYKNFTIMSEYMTEMGRIKHSRDTGLRPKNQRKIAKAIRRAIGLGLMPSVHRHPLVLKNSSPARFIG